VGLSREVPKVICAEQDSSWLSPTPAWLLKTPARSSGHHREPFSYKTEYIFLGRVKEGNFGW
jgi:hypothetical protein